MEIKEQKNGVTPEQKFGKKIIAGVVTVSVVIFLIGIICLIMAFVIWRKRNAV